ncbi:hypothetical protein RvY_03219 [Ramazzottius varieornatus]|uniref:Uncharacterized protein n=1 Tax=Ramazzottius varieornatus TaxID=947166 RepID=A0A1D1UMA1_RAMVA|nr:hypothetical protein RvY_03219 [Ramazzottius varieornatus]
MGWHPSSSFSRTGAKPKHLVRDSILREYFAPGHVRGVRMHELHINGEHPAKFSELYRALNCFKVQQNLVRTMTYYSEYRNDGLVKLVQLPEEVLWYYEGRKDNLVFRRIKYGTQIDRSYAVEALKCKGDQRPIALIMEKFDRNKEEANPDLDIYLRELDITGNTLHLVYQPADGMVMSTQRRYHLPDFNEGPQSGLELPVGFLRMNDDVVSVIFRDQLKEEQRLPIDVWDEMVLHYRKSLEGIVGVRRAEDDFKEEIGERIEEERQPALWHSPYDVERHPRAAIIVNKSQEADLLKQPANEQNAVFDPTSFDWVAPYMAAYGDKEVQSLEDALAVRQTVLEDLRERLLYTANALEKAHELEFAKLQSLNDKFRKAQIAGELSPKDFTIYEKDKAAIQFKMHMLERRQELLQFEGPAKLKKLNDWILQDPRFSRWLQGMQLETRDRVIQDELMTVKKNTPHWTAAQRKKVWKLQSEDGEILVDPLDKEEAAYGRGDASTHRLLSPHAGRAPR